MLIAIGILAGLCAVFLVILVFSLAKISRYGDDMEEKLLQNLDEALKQRACFARFGERCGVLQSTYEPGKCPFCKPSADVTNGKLYPVNPYYEPRKCER